MWRRGRVVGGGAVVGTAQTARASFDATSANIMRTGSRRRPGPIATRVRLSAGAPIARGSGERLVRDGPAASLVIERGERRTAALDASSAREDADVVARTSVRRRIRRAISRWTPSPRRRTTPASRARVVVDAGRDRRGGWTMRGFRSRPARGGNRQTRRMRERSPSYREVTLAGRCPAPPRRDFVRVDDRDGPARLARRRRLSARVFASHFKRGAPPVRVRSTATAGAARAVNLHPALHRAPCCDGPLLAAPRRRRPLRLRLGRRLLSLLGGRAGVAAAVRRIRELPSAFADRQPPPPSRSATRSTPRAPTCCGGAAAYRASRRKGFAALAPSAVYWARDTFIISTSATAHGAPRDGRKVGCRLAVRCSSTYRSRGNGARARRAHSRPTGASPPRGLACHRRTVPTVYRAVLAGDR